MAQFRKDSNQYLPDGKTIFEVVMLADQFGNVINNAANPSGVAVDAFGRARMSQPITLFDSSHRYQDNGKFNTANNAGTNTSYNANSSTVSLNIGTTSGQYVYRETARVFSYQPGKSLQILNTFVMNQQKAGLRQRIGYFSNTNGIYLEANNTSEPTFNIRSNSNNAIQLETVSKSNWNIDPLDGNGPSKLTLDLTKSQIFWTDIEWLGVGSVRCGFVINGQLIHCHSFHHSNSFDRTYMTTATLPVRHEIENVAGTASNSTLQTICTSVLSEGGYEPRGRVRTYGMDPGSSKTLTSVGTYYPLVSIRLNPDKQDSVVVPGQVDFLPITTDNYRWKIVTGGTWTGDTWANVASDSSVQYQSNSSATVTGYTEMQSGYATATVQGGGFSSVTDGDMFRFQLERNSFTNTMTTFTLLATSQKATSNAAGAIGWMEIT